MKYRNLILIALSVFILVSCQSGSVQKPLPEPHKPCPIRLEWRGLQPGVSTKSDVTRTLGKPIKTKAMKFDKKQVTGYLYENDEEYPNDLLDTWIFIRPDGVVDWIEISAFQKDIHFRSVKEIYDQVGTVDTIFTNNNFNPAYRMFDVLGGPGKVYVWSGCGLAVIGLPFYTLDQNRRLHRMNCSRTE